MSFIDIIWIFVILQFFIPLMQKRWQMIQRLNMIRKIESLRKSRMITMIHRQEVMSLLGFPIGRYIDIEDSEQILRAIRMTPPEMPLDLLIHTPGGLVLAAEQIAEALKRHKGKVTVLVPHYAMSGGTLVALGADSIVMDPDAVLGPVDPQLGAEGGGFYPAVSILKALEEPNPNRSDHTLIMADIARKAISQVNNTVYQLLLKHMDEKKASDLSKMLSEGKWTHDYPISFEEAKEMGLPVDDKMPLEIYQLMELYPQSAQRRPSVEFIPTPYVPPRSPGHSPGKD